MGEENQMLKEQNIKLRSEITFLGNRINILKQKNLEKCIEIIGVKTVEKIINNELGVKSLTITNAYRMQSKIMNQPRKIVVELNSKQSKNNLMDSSRILKIRGNTYRVIAKNGRTMIVIFT